MDVLLERIDLKLDIHAGNTDLTERLVMFGGPVQVERGFVLHVPQGTYSSTIKVSEDIALTTSKDVLEALAVGQGPERILVTLGCAGWSAGQLESEIARNGWLTVQADASIVFDLPAEQRFAAAMQLLGIDPMMLSGSAGHA
jgi:putative transcriptional regulator